MAGLEQPQVLPTAFAGSSFYELALILLGAAIAGALAVRLRQPLIVAYIVSGILFGPSGLGVVQALEEIDLLARLGISVLLFLVGLRLDLHLLRSLGSVAVATGLGQVVFTSVVGFFLARLLGIGFTAALYVSVALTFSSTIIVVKLLSDKREIDSLHGRIAVGFLIVQDIVVIAAMILLSALGGSDPWFLELARRIGGGLVLLAGIGVLTKFLLPAIVHHVARSPELLVLFAVAWSVALASLGDLVGLSKEIGAFLGGVSLASTPFREAIGSRLVGLRDFLLLFFFIDLGARLDLTALGAEWSAGAVLSVFVLIGNPLIVMVIMGTMGYRKRTGFLAGLTVAQISEFSFILGSLGVRLGHIDSGAMGLITLVGLVTIGLSTYMILYSHWLYERIAPWLTVFERSLPHRESAETTGAATQADVILFGLGRYGSRIGARLEERGLSVLGVDFDPEIVAAWTKKGKPVCYGDAEDPDFPATLPLARARWILSSIPQEEASLSLVRALRGQGFGGGIAVAAHTAAAARRLEQAGANLVLLPFSDAADRAAEALTDTNALVGPSEKPVSSAEDGPANTL